MTETKKQRRDLRLILLLLVVILVTGMHWLILVLRIPVLDALPYWKFTLRFTPLNVAWIALAFIAFGLAVALSLGKSNYALKLAVIIILGATIQFSLAYSKGQGLDGLRSRIVDSGHAEFARVAARPLGLRYVIKNYETMIHIKAYDYLPSKPPGTLLFYMLTDRAAQVFWPAVNQNMRLENLRTFASMTWPFISYFVVIPIFFLARELFDNPDTGITASVIYISVPSLNLITLHTDQVIYPFLASIPVLLAVMACRRGNLWVAFISGIAFYGMIYFSFGLAVIGLLFFLPVFAAIPNTNPKARQDSLRCMGVIGMGVLLSNACAYVFTNYDILTRYHEALNHHLLWKGWENNLGTYWSAGVTDVIEFSVWIGMPLTILFLACIGLSFRKITIGKSDIFSLYNGLIAAIFLFMLAFGKTKAETARLWLFLVPFICLSVAKFIAERPWSKRDQTLFTCLILLLEIGTTFLTLHYQDFN
jgi:hypothetical protein